MWWKWQITATSCHYIAYIIVHGRHSLHNSCKWTPSHIDLYIIINNNTQIYIFTRVDSRIKRHSGLSTKYTHLQELHNDSQCINTSTHTVIEVPTATPSSLQKVWFASGWTGTVRQSSGTRTCHWEIVGYRPPCNWLLHAHTPGFYPSVWPRYPCILTKPFPWANLNS